MTDAALSVPTEAQLVHRTCHTDANGDPLSDVVASAIAVADDTDPSSTSWALTDYVDPDALDSLFVQYHDSLDGYCRLEFIADDYRVIVESDGTISVYEADVEQSSSP